MTKNISKTLLGNSYSPIVSVWLGLITKRLLDTLVEALRNNQLGLCQGFAFLTIVIILAQNFVLLFMICADVNYKVVLERALHKNVVGLFVATQLIMVCLYVMAFWFPLRTDQYIMLSTLLVFLWLVFDYYCIESISYTMRLPNGQSDSLNSLLQSVKAWRLFDIVLLALLLLLLFVLWKHALGLTSASAFIALLFATTAYIVPRVFEVQLTLGGQTSSTASASSVLPNAYLGENASASAVVQDV